MNHADAYGWAAVVCYNSYWA